jgi:hypothetical protein
MPSMMKNSNNLHQTLFIVTCLLNICDKLIGVLLIQIGVANINL